MNEKAFGIIFVLAFLLILLAIIIAITYISTWFDKWNCDSLGGAFRIENDGWVQKTICEVRNITQIQIHTSKCYKNNKEVDCSTFDDYLKGVNLV